MLCPGCGFENENDNKFCNMCGMALPDAEKQDIPPAEREQVSIDNFSFDDFNLDTSSSSSGLDLDLSADSNSQNENSNDFNFDLSANTDLTTLYIVGNDLLKDVNLTLGRSFDYGSYIKLPSGFPVSYTVENQEIAAVESEALVPKKVGTTTATLSIGNTKKEFSGATVVTDFVSNITVDDVRDCIPQMTGGRRYKINFIVNGGDEIDPINEMFDLSVKLSEEKIDLPTPTKKGFKFVGWYEDEKLKKSASIKSFADILDLENVNDNVCSDNVVVNLYAKWEEDVSNPKTGVSTFAIIDAVIVLAAGVTYFVISKKNKINKI